MRSAPPDAADSPPVPASVDQDAAQGEQPGGPAVRRRRRRRRLLIAAPFLVLLSWAVVSYTTWMLQPTSMSWSGAQRRVGAEPRCPSATGWSTTSSTSTTAANAPKKGGPQLKSLPTVGLNPPRRTVRGRRPPPGRRAIKPVFAHPLPGEGVWKPTGPPVDGGPPVLVTTFRPELDYPQHRRLRRLVRPHAHRRSAYYPGRYEPPNAAVRGPMMVPYEPALAAARDLQRRLHLRRRRQRLDRQRPHERAAEGRQRHARRLSRRSRRHREVERRPERRAGRRLGPPEPGSDRLERTTEPHVERRTRTARSGGTRSAASPASGAPASASTRRGNLIYVAADDQTVITIAKILQHVGAVRAMEFDINPDWHTLITYTHRHGLVPTMVGPNPNQSPNRYLVPDDRDFFAVYRPPARSGHRPLQVGGRTSVPWGACQESRARMSSAPRVVPKTLPSSMTLENSLAFLAFSAMTFSSIVSLATRR